MMIKLVHEPHVARLTFNRPQARHALNHELIREFLQVLSVLRHEPDLKALVLTGSDGFFCAGADLNEMKSALDQDFLENKKEALIMSQMFKELDGFPKPTIALVNGPAFGGGVGLVAACDIVLCHESAFFSLSEVKLGLVPSVISPYVIAKIGAQARRFFLTGERFDPQQAKDMGLVHEIVTDQDQENILARILNNILSAGPCALTEAKLLIQKNHELDPCALQEFTTEQIARLRKSPEGQEGMEAFFSKRKPHWLA